MLCLSWKRLGFSHWLGTYWKYLHKDVVSNKSKLVRLIWGGGDGVKKPLTYIHSPKSVSCGLPKSFKSNPDILNKWKRGIIMQHLSRKDSYWQNTLKHCSFSDNFISFPFLETCKMGGGVNAGFSPLVKKATKFFCKAAKTHTKQALILHYLCTINCTDDGALWLSSTVVWDIGMS